MIEKVFLQNGWPCNQVRAGKAGSFPTFVVDRQRVIKFFGPLFEGAKCWQVEQEAAQLMKNVPEVPVAGLLGSGSLESATGWNYLVFEYLPGSSIGEFYKQICWEDRLALAGWLGEWLSCMHRTKEKGGSCMPHLSRDMARGWFGSRWPEEQKQWPKHLANQVEDYLTRNDALLQSSCEAFVHADLTQDHLLGELVAGHWRTQGVIDFGDAMWGNIYYELAALHLDLFDGDKRLLKTFLEAYDLPRDADFPRKAMVTTLMHQFDVYAHLFAWKPELQESGSMESLADRLWKIEG